MNNSIWTRDLVWEDVAKWLIFAPFFLMVFGFICVCGLFKSDAKGHYLSENTIGPNCSGG